HRGQDRELTVARARLADHGDVRAGLELDRLLKLADPELWALQVGDERKRTALLLLDLADELRPGRVILVAAVRHVQPGGVHARGDERAHGLERRGRGTDRRDDLGAARWLGRQGPPSVATGRPRART